MARLSLISLDIAVGTVLITDKMSRKLLKLIFVLACKIHIKRNLGELEPTVKITVGETFVHIK